MSDLLASSRDQCSPRLCQALSEQPRDVWSAASTLMIMYSKGRTEAAVFLMGLVKYYEDDLERLSDVVEHLGNIHLQKCADLLFEEVKRLKSSNTTRRYLNLVLKRLAAFPLKMVEDGFESLESDHSHPIRPEPIMQAGGMERVSD